MSSTLLIPGALGWASDNAGSSAALRLRVAYSYELATNQSTLTVTPEGYCKIYTGSFALLDNASLSVNGVTLISPQTEAGTGSTGYTLRYEGDETWRPLQNEQGQSAAFTVTVQHDADGAARVPFRFRGQFFFYYSGTSYRISFSEKNTELWLNESRRFPLSITGDGGAEVSVRLNGRELQSGDELGYGDEVSVSYRLKTGYRVREASVNGRSFSVSTSHTVTGAVAVRVLTELRPYAMRWECSGGAQIALERLTSPLGGATGSLAESSPLFYGDTLRVTAAAPRGRSLTLLINGESFENPVTVTGSLVISAVAAAAGVYIDTGLCLVPARVLLDTGSAWAAAGLP